MHYINFISCFSTALEEARDINMHLKPLRRLLDDMEQFDFSELEKIIPAILHTVGLIWANSKYYCRAPRMIVLLQELCNMLIEMVSNLIKTDFLEGDFQVLYFVVCTTCSSFDLVHKFQTLLGRKSHLVCNIEHHWFSPLISSTCHF